MRFAHRSVLLASLAVLVTGCWFLPLSRNLKEIGRTTALRGHVQRRADPAGPPSPIIVVLSVSSGASRTPIDSVVLRGPGPFFFVVTPGSYTLSAFEDRNGNGKSEPGEPGGYFGKPDTVAVDGTQHEIDGLEIELAEHPAISIDPFDAETLATAPSGLGGPASLGQFLALGEVVSIDDPRFSHENAARGIWAPVEFALHARPGVYFLEPRDPAKTPVLFIHGMGGHPREFEFLIERLDRSRFQPWLVYYPSAIRLDRLSERLLQMASHLRARHPFDQLLVVAHSMGGLVARAFVLRAQAAGLGDALPLLVTISTPWAGHAAAAKGVERAPVVVPSWLDMAPGSDFLRSLFATPLPPGVSHHHLLFSFEGSSLVIDGNSDGTVPLRSELDPRAQAEARRLRGFPEDHTSILRSEDVARTLDAILYACSSGTPKRCV